MNVDTPFSFDVILMSPQTIFFSFSISWCLYSFIAKVNVQFLLCATFEFIQM